MRAIGRRIALRDIPSLFPNPFYRIPKLLSQMPPTSSLSESGRYGEAPALDGVCKRAGNAEKDAAAYVAFLDAQKQVMAKKEDRNPGLIAWVGRWL